MAHSQGISVLQDVAHELCVFQSLLTQSPEAGSRDAPRASPWADEGELRV